MLGPTGCFYFYNKEKEALIECGVILNPPSLRARSKMQNRFLDEQCGRPWKKEMETYLRTYPLACFPHEHVGPSFGDPKHQ
jgi:hypothetical protein